MSDVWKQCSSCKREIAFGARYWACSVSTCNRARTPRFFCKVSCWDAHLPLERHRSSAYAVEKRAPSRQDYERELAAAAEAATAKASRASTSSGSSASSSSGGSTGAVKKEVLIVASRLKKYVDQRAQLRMADNVLHALSHLVRRECELAISAAGNSGRKTVMARDFVRPVAGTDGGEVLVVVSRLKAYVKASAGMNTSGDVAAMLSRHIRGWTNDAIRNAREAERGTLYDRDFED